MTPELWLTLLGSLGIPVIITTAFNFLSNRNTLRNSAPRVDAEADEIAGRAQVQVIENMRREMTRLSEKAERAEQTADAAIQKANEREKNMRREFEEMKDGFGKQVEKILAENDSLRKHNRLLVLHIERLTEWADRNYREGHADRLGPPPKLADFHAEPNE